jgi:rubrerythrin
MPSATNESVSRAQFLRNVGVGGVALVSSGSVIAAVTSQSASAAVTGGDIETLQAAYIAESLAVFVYSEILRDFRKFRHPRLQNRDYFEAALRDERDHKAFLHSALGSKTPTGLRFKIPARATRTGEALLRTGVALETAFVEAYLGASETFSSQELRTIAAKVAANEATHFSFFDAAAGGHGVLPAIPASATIPATVKKLQPFLA